MSIFGSQVGGVLLKIVLWFFGILIFGGLGFFGWYLFKGGKKFPFLLYSRDGTTTKTIYATVKVDPANKDKKSFIFKDIDAELTIRAPTLFLDGKPYREVTYTDDGGLAYLENKPIDRDKFLQKALNPEEKQISLFRMKENNIRYENPMNKYQAYLLGGMLILGLLLMIGIIYSTITYAKVAKDHVTLAKENKQISSSNNQLIQTVKDISEQQASIAGALTSDKDIIRQIS